MIVSLCNKYNIKKVIIQSKFLEKLKKSIDFSEIMY